MTREILSIKFISVTEKGVVFEKHKLSRNVRMKNNDDQIFL